MERLAIHCRKASPPLWTGITIETERPCDTQFWARFGAKEGYHADPSSREGGVTDGPRARAQSTNVIEIRQIARLQMLRAKVYFDGPSGSDQGGETNYDKISVKVYAEHA